MIENLFDLTLCTNVTPLKIYYVFVLFPTGNLDHQLIFIIKSTNCGTIKYKLRAIGKSTFQNQIIYFRALDISIQKQNRQERKNIRQ